MLGISARLRVLIVCHCYRASDTVIRLISARKADKREEADYNLYLRDCALNRKRLNLKWAS